MTSRANQQFAYVGAHSRAAIEAGADPDTTGISVFAVDAETGGLRLIQTVASDNPFFFAFDPARRFLFVVNVLDDYEGKRSGSVEAYSVDSDTGKLTFINRQSSNGATAADLAVDPTGKFLVVANYSGANFVVLPINNDGSLEPVVSSVVQTGSGPNQTRQEGPHPHAVVFDPAGAFVAGADLGTDKVIVFRLDQETGELKQVSEASTAPGAGPRHLAFNADGTLLYVLNELGATITVFSYDAASGTIREEIQTIATLPQGFDGTTDTAEILIHPSGRFLYNSNRGRPEEAAAPEGDAIVGFTIDPESGELSLIDYYTEEIAFPWSFAFDRGGRWLYSANYDDDTITSFSIDADTGRLTRAGASIVTPKPYVIVLSNP